jgi:Protein of unknown function (DUF3179)
MRLACIVRRLVALVLAALAMPALAAPPPQPPPGDVALIRSWRPEWHRTDFLRHTVPLEEIVSGGPPRDGIPPLDKPAFVPAAEADAWLTPDEPVLAFEHGGDVRAYPLQILIWHEIVNDTVGGLPVAVTFCPLCNSALVFERRVGGTVLDFGTTGKLRHSDLVMWDRQTESWWQQLTGEAIVGARAGERLRALPAPVVAWRTFRAANPQGRVLSRRTGFSRPYGANPYVGYDDPGSERPFLFRGTPDARLRPMERVLAVEREGAARAWPYAQLRRVGVVNDRLGDLELVLIFAPGTRSALDRNVLADSREVGTAVVYDRRVQGRTLTFQRGGAPAGAESDSVGFVSDRETGTRWSLLGEAVQGPLRGEHLTPVPHSSPFAFAWLAFRPESTVYRAP